MGVRFDKRKWRCQVVSKVKVQTLARGHRVKGQMMVVVVVTEMVNMVVVMVMVVPIMTVSQLEPIYGAVA